MDILIQAIIWLFKNLFGDQERQARLGSEEPEEAESARRGPYRYGDERSASGPRAKTLAELLEEARRGQGAPTARAPASAPRPVVANLQDEDLVSVSAAAKLLELREEELLALVAQGQLRAFTRSGRPFFVRDEVVNLKFKLQAQRSARIAPPAQQPAPPPMRTAAPAPVQAPAGGIALLSKARQGEKPGKKRRAPPAGAPAARTPAPKPAAALAVEVPSSGRPRVLADWLETLRSPRPAVKRAAGMRALMSLEVLGPPRCKRPFLSRGRR